MCTSFHPSLLFLAIPEPANNFRATSTTSSTISLAWNYPLNTSPAIIGGVLNYFAGSDSPSTMNVTGTTAVLTGLTPSIFYNINIILVNPLGHSVPVSLIQRTNSNG